MSKFDLSMEANYIRKKLGEDTSSPIDVFACTNRIDNLTVIFNELGENISGLTHKGKKSSIIAINSAMTLGRQHFSMAHELYHLFIDETLGTIVCSGINAETSDNGKKADSFAASFLMPKDGVYDFIKNHLGCNNRLKAEDVVKLEQYFQVSHSAMLIRLKELDFINQRELNSFSDNAINQAVQLNYSQDLYKITGKKETYGYHIALARDLYEKNRISYGRLKEIMLDAGRTDVLEQICLLEEDVVV